MVDSKTQSYFALLDEAGYGWFNRTFESALNLALTAGFAWLLAEGALQFRLTPTALLVEAASCSCLVCLWSWGTGATLRAIAPFRAGEDVAVGSRRIAFTAAWTAPAAILLANASPGAFVAAPVLAVSAGRLLYRQHALSVSEPENGPSSVLGLRALVPAVAAAQAAICALVFHRVLLGAIFGALGAAILTLVALDRGLGAASQRLPDRMPALKVATRITLATLLTIAGLATCIEYRDPSSVAGTDQVPGSSRNIPRFLRNLLSEPTAQAATAAPTSRPHAEEFGLGGVYSGVVLQPEVKSYVVLVTPRPNGAGWGSVRRPFHIPFGGEYWMYRTPSLRPPPGSHFRRSTPTAQIYQTTDGVPLEMEARQHLDQAIEMRCCSEIQIEIRNAEPDSADLALQLMLGNRERRLWQDLGQKAVLSRPKSSHLPVAEALSFPMLPDKLRDFDEFRVVFQRGPKIANKSVKVAIERFALVPR
jgi:hypothetical protein